MTYDFTLKTYEELCKAISSVQKDCRFVHYLEHKDESRVILRHDVDRKPRNALRMAELEHRLGLKATYYFRCVPSSFDAEIICAISDMGHEVGYHYEVMSRAKGDVQKAKVIFQQDLERLRSICEIRTACMHGSPGSKHNNLEFWHHVKMASYGIVGEAYHGIAAPCTYFTDTGGAWNGSNNLRDRVSGCMMPTVAITRELVDNYLPQHSAGNYISCHPERWSNSSFESIIYNCKDKIVNMMKRTLSRLYGPIKVKPLDMELNH